MIDSGVRYTLHSDAGVRLTPIERFDLGLMAAVRELRLTPAEALRAATATAAEAIGLSDRGVLTAGKRADLITVSMAAARQTPMYDAVSHLVYVTRGDDVRTTIVNGKVLMQNRQVRTLNRTEVIAQAKDAVSRARRSAVIIAFMIAASLAVGAAAAWLAAVTGGRHRDHASAPVTWWGRRRSTLAGP